MAKDKVDRLPKAAKAYDIKTTISEELAPYLELWHLQTMEAGETIEQFVLRMIKTGALNHHIAAEVQIAQAVAEEEKNTVFATLNADIQQLATEVP